MPKYLLCICKYCIPFKTNFDQFHFKKIFFLKYYDACEVLNYYILSIQEHVVGRQCNKCNEGTFGLAADNPKGCTECFCFGRTTSCQQGDLSWGQRRLTRPRTLYVNDTSNDILVSIACRVM